MTSVPGPLACPPHSRAEVFHGDSLAEPRVARHIEELRVSVRTSVAVSVGLALHPKTDLFLWTSATWGPKIMEFLKKTYLGVVHERALGLLCTVKCVRDQHV
jgi:hypothetical protein